MIRRVVFLLAVGLLMAADAPKDSSVDKELKRLNVPDKLIPKKGQALFLLRAEGVQIYTGVEKDGKLQWSPAVPKAELLDYDTGEKVGTHSKGPVWEGADGSKVDGKKIENEHAPNANAVDWLLLEGKGDGGKGKFGKVTFIVRIDTWAGKPPSKPDKVGEVKEVRYQATYVFFGPSE